MERKLFRLLCLRLKEKLGMNGPMEELFICEETMERCVEYNTESIFMNDQPVLPLYRLSDLLPRANRFSTPA